MENFNLALKYRPRTKGELKGQDSIKRILANEIGKGQLSQGLLFAGVRGTGKTTMARMVGEWINCLHATPEGPCGECPNCRSIRTGSCIDISEIDAASNNKVEDVMNLLDSIYQMPTQLSKKVIILDEVHNLTKQAFDKLLKVLEEPPRHVQFILCTTELHKLPATILSRLERHDFRVLSQDIIVEHLLGICEKEGVEIEQEAVSIIANQSGGSMRDALTILQPLIYDSPITEDKVRAFYGLSSLEEVLSVTKAVVDGDIKVLSSYLIGTKNSPSSLVKGVLNALCNIIIMQTGGRELGVGSETYCDTLFSIGESVSKSRILGVFEELAPLSGNSNTFLVQATMFRVAMRQYEENDSVKRINALEERIRLLENGVSPSNDRVVGSVQPVPATPVVSEASLPTPKPATTAESGFVDAEMDEVPFENSKVVPANPVSNVVPVKSYDDIGDGLVIGGPISLDSLENNSDDNFEPGIAAESAVPSVSLEDFIPGDLQWS